MAWLTNWNYRKEITISSGSSLTDYQVSIVVDTASLISSLKMQSDCRDIRLADTDGITLLNYWIESGCNTSSTKIWAKIPSIPIGTKTIYIYYGNVTVTNGNDGSNTFEFFDDFASYSGSINGQGGWVTTAAGSSSATVSGGILDLYRDGANDIGTTHNIGTLSTKFVYTILSKPQNFNSNKYFYTWESAQYATTTSFWYERSDYASAQRSASGEGLDVTRLGTPTYDVYHRVEIFVDTTGATVTHKYYEDGNLISGALTTTKTSTTTYNRISFGVSAYVGIGHHYIDYVHIRKYESPEPTVSNIGTEQISPGSLKIISTPTGAGIWLAPHGQTPLWQTPAVYTPEPVTDLTIGFYDIRLTKNGYEDWIFINAEVISGTETQISANLVLITPANIIVTNITATPSETPCIAGTCTMTINVTWTNTGGTSGTFIPSIIVDDNPIVVDPPLDPVTIGPYGTMPQEFIIIDLASGTHHICLIPT